MGGRKETKKGPAPAVSVEKDVKGGEKKDGRSDGKNIER